MTKKQLVIDTKNTIWHRTHIEISAETEQELQEKINNFNFNDYESYEEIDTEYLYDTVEELPLSENQYNSTIELVGYTNKGYITLKDNLQDIDKEDVKMFSINDIKDIWSECYKEDIFVDYLGFYEELLKRIG